MKRGGFGAAPLGFFVLCTGMFYLALHPAVDPDYGWHIAAGRHVIDGATLSGTDPFSWITAGSTWRDPEWMTEFLMSRVHDTLGPAANSLIAAALWAGVFALVGFRLRGRGFRWVATSAVSALAFCGSLMSVGVRPQVFELLFFALALYMLDKYVDASRKSSRLLFATALGSIVWANSHGSFPLLVVAIALTSLGRAIERDARWKQLCAAAVLAGFAATVNPWGIGLFHYATEAVTSNTTMQLIQEWRAPDLTSGSLLPLDLELVLAAFGAAVFTMRFVRKSPVDPKESPDTRESVGAEDVLIAVAIGILAVRSGRHVMLFGIAAAPLIAWTVESIAAMLGASRTSTLASHSVVRERGEEIINYCVATGVAVYVLLAGWRTISPDAQERAINARYPSALLDDLSQLSSRRVFNEYTWGGYLIERGHLPVFIDGRSELYGDEKLSLYYSITRLRPAWKRQLDSVGVNTVIMPTGSPLTVALRAQGWKQVAADSVGEILHRGEAGPPARNN